MTIGSSLSRRHFLAATAGFSCAFPLAARADDELVCTRPYAGDKEQRDGLHYTEHASDANKTCENCQYFQARGSCGNCRIFSTLVNPNGTCDSWSKKTG